MNNKQSLFLSVFFLMAYPASIVLVNSMELSIEKPINTTDEIGNKDRDRMQTNQEEVQVEQKTSLKSRFLEQQKKILINSMRNYLENI
ncbi:hypothetical protein [Candidatus Paracaedibacter symbiosus]|uniref:hypothetical protein n=1 Tax=Candidatus Paracaedibacter symbiosus TaxID=244582 RepID=UPI000509BC94|nr:hypothetical protein [Candidatus Paracaedibacter symbiosus]